MNPLKRRTNNLERMNDDDVWKLVLLVYDTFRYSLFIS